MVTIETSKGNIKLELFADKAPVTVENFLKYVKSGFYSNTIFHRVIKGFMIQGGGMEPGLIDKEGGFDPIKNEADNGVANEEGTIAMARTMEPHSASNQFFINTVNNSFLNYKSPTPDGWGYCVFGKVVEGMDVVKAIEAVTTGRMGYHSDVPKEEVLILNVSVED